MAEKRHLPVLNSKASAEDEAPRVGAFGWALLGALSIFVLFLPLGMLGLWASTAITRLFGGTLPQGYAQASILGLLGAFPLVFSFAVASFGGAGLVGRYSPTSRWSLSSIAGLLAAMLVVAVAAAQGALRPYPIAILVFAILGVVAGLSGYVGGRFGRRFRA